MHPYWSERQVLEEAFSVLGAQGFAEVSHAGGCDVFLPQAPQGREHKAAGARSCQCLPPRAVDDTGNPRARALLEQFFQPSDALWRGIGCIPQSGLTLRPEYESMDAMSALASPCRTFPPARLSLRRCAQGPHCPARLPPLCKVHARQSCGPLHGFHRGQLRQRFSPKYSER